MAIVAINVGSVLLVLQRKFLYCCSEKIPETRSNLHFNCEGDLVYFVAACCVVYNRLSYEHTVTVNIQYVNYRISDFFCP